MPVCVLYDSWILTSVKLDGRQEGRNKEKSGCALAAYCHRPPAAVPASGCATSGVGYMCRVIPSGNQSYHIHRSSLLYCCHRQDSFAPGSAGATERHTTVVTAVASVLGLLRVGLISMLCTAFQCKYTYILPQLHRGCSSRFLTTSPKRRIINDRKNLTSVYLQST